MQVTPQWQEDDQRNVFKYSNLITKYGINPKSLDWGSAESQLVRFQVLSEIHDMTCDSVLDVGCGLGDLYGWLKARGKPLCYKGIDITPAMVDVARTRFPSTEFAVCNLLESNEIRPLMYDYVVLSGVFAQRTNAPRDYLEAMVSRMFEICRKGVAFNSLSSWASVLVAGEFYADPLATVAFCRKLTPWVVLRHDYLQHDFTVYMYRAPSGMNKGEILFCEVKS